MGSNAQATLKPHSTKWLLDCHPFISATLGYTTKGNQKPFSITAEQQRELGLIMTSPTGSEVIQGVQSRRSSSSCCLQCVSSLVEFYSKPFSFFCIPLFTEVVLGQNSGIQFLCQLDSHIPSLSVDLMCAVNFLCLNDGMAANVWFF